MEVTYDLSRSPVTFDFLNFLVRAERLRLERGAESLSVNIKLGERIQSIRDRDFSWERKQYRVSALLAQLPWLLPSVSAVTIGGDGVQEVGYEQATEYVPVFKAPDSAMAAVSEYVRVGKPYVTITIRDSDFQPERNSNAAEWLKVADWLAECGYAVIFVPDTEAMVAGRPLDTGDHMVYEAAAFNQALRLALYEHAMLNCFTSGGPMMLSMWAKSPTFICKLKVDGVHSCSEEVLNSVGMAPDARPDRFQWLSWCDDTKDNITPLLEDILPVCQRRMRPLVLPMAFSVMHEDDRKAAMKAAIERGHASLQPVLPHDRHAILVCYGPSLKHTAWEIPQIAGDVFTVSGAHDFMVDMGITPYGHIESDPRPHKAELITKPQAATQFYIASCCHAAVFDRLAGHQVTLWHAWNSSATDKQVMELDPNGFIIEGGSNVGLRAMSLLTGLGYRLITIFGLDCSFDIGGAQHAGFHSGKKQRVMKVFTPDGRWYWTSPSMLAGCDDFFKLLPAFVGCDISLKGDGLLQHRLRLSQPSLQEKAA